MNPEKQLVRLLTDEVQVYKHLLEIKLSERQALFDYDDQALSRVVVSEEELIESAENLEQRRKQIVAEISADGDDSKQLSEILADMQPEYAARCRSLSQELLDICAQLAQKQFENAQIMRSASQFLQEFVSSMVAKAQSQLATYTVNNSHSGRSENLPGMLDQKV